MPPLEQWERELETFTLFPYAGRDIEGIIRTGPPVEITGRWVDIQQETPARDSSEITMTARVVLDRDVAIGSLLWHGLLADYEDGTGTASNELAEVRRVETVKDVKSRATRWQATCSRYAQKANP